MNPHFSQLIESLEPQFQRLVGMAPVRYGALPRDLPERGIYLLSEAGAHQYVGRTNRLRRRLRNHFTPSGSHFTATCAFRIARHTTGRTKAAYTKAGSRAELLKDVAFAAAFRQAKARVAAMDIRYVEESDATRQALLELYVATALGTPFIDFDNH